MLDDRCRLRDKKEGPWLGYMRVLKKADYDHQVENIEQPSVLIPHKLFAMKKCLTYFTAFLWAFYANLNYVWMISPTLAETILCFSFLDDSSLHQPSPQLPQDIRLAVMGSFMEVTLVIPTQVLVPWKDSYERKSFQIKLR